MPACLQDLIQYNNAIRHDLARGTTDTHLQERWEMVQQCAAQIINSDLPGMQTAGQAPVKPMRWAALLSMPDTWRLQACWLHQVAINSLTRSLYT